MNTAHKAAALAGSLVLSVALVSAFDVANTGERTVDVSVVDDSNAFLALEENGASDHSAFVSVTSGQVKIDISSATGVSGTGVNVDSTYEFNTILNVTNNGDSDTSVSVSFTGTDSSSCEAALTSTTSQSSSDYDPSPSLSVSEDSTAYFGFKVTLSSASSGDTLDCSAELKGS